MSLAVPGGQGEVIDAHGLVGACGGLACGYASAGRVCDAGGGAERLGAGGARLSVRSPVWGPHHGLAGGRGLLRRAPLLWEPHPTLILPPSNPSPCCCSSTSSSPPLDIPLPALFLLLLLFLPIVFLPSSPLSCCDISGGGAYHPVAPRLAVLPVQHVVDLVAALPLLLPPPLLLPGNLSLGPSSVWTQGLRGRGGGAAAGRGGEGFVRGGNQSHSVSEKSAPPK